MKLTGVILVLMAAPAFAQSSARMGEYALILADPPVAQVPAPSAQAHLRKLQTTQRAVLSQLAARKIRVRRASTLLTNAIYIDSAQVRPADLAGLPGVERVQFLPPVRRDLNAAIGLVNASAAWSAVGGAANAGDGVKIGIIDTGIDQNHPGFADAGFTMPSGFPKGDAAYTNKKVIVARSYVNLLTLTDPTYSTPDDLSPRDRTGHGTAIAMIAAGVSNKGPLATIQGVAPKAFLGNYKVFGSPGVNDYTYADVIEQALTDAVNDGMDVVTLSLNEGDIALFGPLDGQAACGDDVCDVRAQAVENAVKAGVTVVTSAGNDGNTGNIFPRRNSIHTPGTAPSAITVGATQNSHTLSQALKYNNTSVRGLFADGTRAASPLTAPIIDVASTGDNGLGCSALPAGSLTGAIALVQRGTCFYSDKINHAQAAGAIAVVIYQSEGIQDIFPILFVQNTAIPAMLIGNTDGKALKSFLSTAVSRPAATLDPAFTASDNGSVNAVASFSSRGPSIGNFANQRDFAVKPELVAPGSDLYTATQKLDPNGDTYNPTGYAAVSGTSYAVPFVAGAVAIVKQKNPNLNTPARLKSAVVNTATSDLQGGAHVVDSGAGKLSIGDAINVAATLDPAAISFGVAPTALPANRTVTVTNVSSAAATFTFTTRAISSESSSHVQVTPSSVQLAPGASTQVTVALTGTRPGAGSYEGFLDVTGAGPTLHLPYTYFVGDGIAASIAPISGGGFTGFPLDQGFRVGLRVTDQYGVPVSGVPTNLRVQSGNGKIENFDSSTDVIGAAAGFVDLSAQLGDQIFVATAGSLTQEFDGFAIPKPAIKAGGIVNAASFTLGQGIAPGSYISLFGTNLADTQAAETTASLPVSLASAAVSFDVGSLSLPGRIHFVSPGQINVQVPWELQGQSTVKLKITQGVFYPSDVIDVPVTQYSPGIFAVTDANGALISASNPAKRGGSIVIYANGLGPVDHQPATGEATPNTQPLASTQAAPSVSIGSASTQLIFSGLTPGSIGLYQVNVSIPTDAPTGTQSLKLSIGGQDTTKDLVVQ